MSTDPSSESPSSAGRAEIQRWIQRNVRLAFLVALIVHLLIGFLLRYSGIASLPPRMVTMQLLPYKPLPKTANDLDLDVRPTAPNTVLDERNSVARDRADKRNKPPGLPSALGDVQLDNAETTENPATGPLSPRTGGLSDLREAAKTQKWSKDSLVRPDARGKTARSDQTLKEWDPDKPVQIVTMPDDDMDERARPDPETSGPRKPRKFGWGGTRPGLPKYKNQATIAKDVGDIAFSTLAWDYEPYGHKVRQRVKDHWFTPPVFNMGLVSGRVTLQFKILKNGRVEDIEVLTRREDRAYQSIVQACVNAITTSDPFPPLPYDFPDAFLGVRFTFNHILYDGQ